MKASPLKRLDIWGPGHRWGQSDREEGLKALNRKKSLVMRMTNQK